MAAVNRRRFEAVSRGSLWVAAAIVLFSGWLQSGAPASVEWLRFEHRAILGGEIWRLLTAHLVHLGWAHYAMNMAALALIAGLVPVLSSARRLLAMLTVSALAVSLGLLVFSPDVDWYVGLSGVLHGLFAAGAVTMLIGERRAEGGLLLALLIAKLLWEQTAGPMPGSAATAGGRVIVDAHLYGAIGGLLMAAVLHAKCRGGP